MNIPMTTTRSFGERTHQGALPAHCENESVRQHVTTPVVNPAEAYTNAEWNNLDPDLRSELETQYVLSLHGVKDKLDKSVQARKRRSIFKAADLEYISHNPELSTQIKRLVEAHKQRT